MLDQKQELIDAVSSQSAVDSALKGLRASVNEALRVPSPVPVTLGTLWQRLAAISLAPRPVTETVSVPYRPLAPTLRRMDALTERQQWLLQQPRSPLPNMALAAGHWLWQRLYRFFQSGQASALFRLLIGPVGQIVSFALSRQKTPPDPYKNYALQLDENNVRLTEQLQTLRQQYQQYCELALQFMIKAERQLLQKKLTLTEAPLTTSALQKPAGAEISGDEASVLDSEAQALLDERLEKFTEKTAGDMAGRVCALELAEADIQGETMNQAYKDGVFEGKPKRVAEREVTQTELIKRGNFWQEQIKKVSSDLQLALENAR